MQSIFKQPAETLKRELRFATDTPLTELIEVAAAGRGDVAGSVALAVSSSLTAGMMFVEIEGGTDGERYLVTGRAGDAAGQIHEAEIEVAVIDGAWVMPDGGAPYLSIAEFVAKFGLEETVRMTDADGAGRIDRSLLVNALSDAQTIAEVHIGARYALPLSSVPATVKLAIGDMARARLYPRGAPEGVADAAKAALKLLERIGTGVLPLPSLEQQQPAPSATPILISPGRRQYPDGLSGY